MKTKTIYVCQSCGTQSSRWEGRCSACGDWNSMVEEIIAAKPAAKHAQKDVYDDSPVLLNDVPAEDKERSLTGISEFDRVMGGGIVPGSVTLIGGDPGIGKSTLTLQVSSRLSGQKNKVLYVSGEESIAQTKMRADRLGTKGRAELFIVNQVDLHTIKQHIKHLKPDVVVIDSIQVMFHPEIASSPGSVSQVRECAAELTHLAKSLGIALFIVGHVTKEGMLAGPRVLEHIVDTVLYFEGERYTSYRILRTTKNRFGSTNEMGVFEMTAAGLQEVNNPSEIFLSERPQDSSGSAVTPILEGTRPFLVEVQGLVSRSSFGVVRQKAQGYDPNRLALLIAVLEKRLDLHLGDQDIFLNIVGGVRVMDPAADLAVVMAVASAFLDKNIAHDTVVVGEVGLSAEVRSVSQLALRIKEAEKLGFKKCIVPQNNLNRTAEIAAPNIQLVGVKTVKEALDEIK